MEERRNAYRASALACSLLALSVPPRPVLPRVEDWEPPVQNRRLRRAQYAEAVRRERRRREERDT